MPVCVPYPNHHQTLSCAVGPSSIHFAHSQSPTTPCLSACHTRQSITLLPQSSFLLLNVVFITVIILVTIESVCGCDGMHHLFAPIINTLCVPLWCHPVWSSLCFGALAVVSVAHHAIVLHTCITFGQWMLLSGTHVASQSPPVHPLHQPFHLVVYIKVLANDGFHFKVVWQVTSAHTGPIHQSPSSECLPTPHITPHGSMGQQC